MQYTENYSLRKPQMAETASVSDINYNTDRIDAIMLDNRQISIDMYASGNTYNTGDLVGHENPSTHHIKVYRCLVDNVTGVWDSAKWAITNLADEILDAKESGGTEVEANPSGTPSDTLNTVKIDSVIYAVGGDSANQNIADAFSTSATYAIGDYCIYESILYKCTTAVTTAGAWDSTKWTPCVVTDEMGSGGGGSSTLAGLDDVGITTPTDGQLLIYDDVNDEWVNGNIAGVNVQPIIYSTNEREIGVWTDGKPLYQKTFSVSNITVDSWQSIAHNISNLSEVVKFGGDFQRNSDGNVFSVPYLETGSVYIAVQVSSALIYYRVNGITTGKINITIQYTKTTDTPGAGTWTPTDVPTVKYIAEEHIIGTFFGETLYEKTIPVQSLTADADNSVNHGITNLGRVIRIFGFAYTTSFNSIPIPMISKSLNSYIINPYSVTSTVIHIETGSSYKGNNALQDIYITLQYTKSSS